jgi:antitoxin component of MazEF toxin-antitoxin module
MNVIRKIVKIGDSKGITIPKSWLDFFKREHGEEIREVTIEVNELLIISPILPKKENNGDSQ